jgi:hypothetical protein
VFLGVILAPLYLPQGTTPAWLYRFATLDSSQAYCFGVLVSPGAKGWVALFWSLWQPRQWVVSLLISDLCPFAMYWIAVVSIVYVVGLEPAP